MTVIKEEFISKSITRHDILPLSFLKKSAYTGSKGGLRFRMEKKDPEEGTEGERVLVCSLWPEPFAYGETDETQIRQKSFAFSDQGIEEALAWMNEALLEVEGHE